MSVAQRLEEIEADFESVEEQLVRDTYPGEDNEQFKDGIVTAAAIFPAVVEDLNDWFYAMDVRVLDKEHLGIPMRYRWSIVRWAEQDMDSWLESHGWTDMAHLNADNRDRREDEMEARYRKEYGDVTVDCNFLVHFPPEVFRKLQEESDGSMNQRKRKQKQKSATLTDVIQARRS